MLTRIKSGERYTIDGGRPRRAEVTFDIFVEPHQTVEILDDEKPKGRIRSWMQAIGSLLTQKERR